MEVMDLDNSTEEMVNSTLATIATISYPREATILAAVCACIFSVVGVVGNFVTTVALLMHPKLRTHVTTMFVLSLCVSDLMFCAINLPLTARRFIRADWGLGDQLCQMFAFVFYGNEAVSLLSMVAITVNRYTLIAYYDMYASIYTTTKIWVQLLLIWLVSFGLMVPPLLGIWGKLGLDKKNLLLHYPRGRVRTLAEKIPFCLRLRAPVPGHHRVLLLHILARAREQEKARGPQQTQRPDSQRKRRRFPPNNTDADHLPLFPGLLPPAHDNERHRRQHKIPLAPHNSLHPSLGVQRNKPPYIRGDQ